MVGGHVLLTYVINPLGVQSRLLKVLRQHHLGHLRLLLHFIFQHSSFNTKLISQPYNGQQTT